MGRSASDTAALSARAAVEYARSVSGLLMQLVAESRASPRGEAGGDHHLIVLARDVLLLAEVADTRAKTGAPSWEVFEAANLSLQRALAAAQQASEQLKAEAVA